MATKAEYVQRATQAYEKYMEIQAKIEKIEAHASVKYNGHSGLISNRLKNGEQYWRYRELCADRTMYMSIAHINASMAAIAE